MDAIPLGYCLQHLYYSSLSPQLKDYVISPAEFAIAGPGFYHLPTWRTDLLATSSFDMVICVQVLQELSPRLLEHMLAVFQRVLKPGGALYIRDHENWGAGHHRNVTALLSRLGFVLEFKPHVQDRRDIHGIPRLWRKRDREVEASQRSGWRHRLLGLSQDFLARFRVG
jgi:SAM-dependent methyltransferase